MAKVGASSGTLRTASSIELETIQLSVSRWAHEYRRLLFGIVGVALVGIAWGLYASYLKRVALEDFRSGVAAFQGGDFDNAIIHLERMGHSSSADVETRAIGLYYLGEAYTKRERNDEAKKSYEEALALAKKGGERSKYVVQLILVKLGQDAEQRGDHTRARQWYDQAASIEGGPLQVEALAQAARSLEKADDHMGATTYYEKLAAKEDPQYPLIEVFREKVGK